MVLLSENSSPPQKRCFHTTHYRSIMDYSNLSIIELKQLLARVNHDLKLNKPTIKRIKQEKAPVLSEGAECNIIAERFTGNKALPIVHNKKLIQDIAIQRDILDYLNNGNNIITHYARGSKRKPIQPLSIISKRIISL
jgi:hypothetical protein